MSDLCNIDNVSAWEKYETKRNDLCQKLDAADAELIDIKKVKPADCGLKEDKTSSLLIQRR